MAIRLPHRYETKHFFQKYAANFELVEHTRVL